MIFIFFVAHHAGAQQMHLMKTTVIGGKASSSVFHFQPSPNGGILWTGYTEDSTGAGDFPACSHRTDSLKMVVGKIDSNGNKEWVHVFCDWNEQISTGCPTADDGYIMGGFKIDTPDLFLTKLDCMGKVQWQRRWGSTGVNGFDGTDQVIQTKDHGYLLLGSTCGNNGDIPFSYRPPNSPFLWQDIVIIKTDSLGNKQWLKIYGSSCDEGGCGVFQIENYYYVISQHENLINDHDFTDSTYPGYRWTFLMKIDSAGTMLWNRSLGALGPNDAMFDDRDSTFLCVSSINDNEPPVYKNDGNTNSDLVVAKISLEGQVLWAKHYGNPMFDDYATGICKGPEHSYLVLGGSDGNFGYPSPIGHTDGLLYWIDSVGNPITHKYYGNTYPETPGKIAPLNKHQFLTSTSYAFTDNPYTEGSWVYNNGVKIGNAFSVWSLWTASTNELTVSKRSLKVYPNPSNDAITIEMPEAIQPCTICIYNNEGKIVSTFKSNNEQRMTISTKGWANGFYTVSCSDKTILHAKLIIQH